MRLDIALVHRARGEAALDDDVGFLEPLRDVALLHFQLAGDVRRLALEHIELVQDRRVRLSARRRSRSPRATPRSRPRSVRRPWPRSPRGGGNRRDGWPGNSAFSRAITLRHIQRMSWMPSITDLSRGNSTISRAVTTAFTPGSASALEVSMPMMRACACGLRRTLPQIMPGMVVSAAKAARPVTLSAPSGRMVRWPIHLLSMTVR